MMMSEKFLSADEALFDQLHQMLAAMKRAGADEAEAVIGEGISFNVQCRNGKMIHTGQAESRDLGLRVFAGKRQAGVRVSFDGLKNIDALAGQVIAMAKSAPEDPYCGLAEDIVRRESIKDLDLYDPKIPNPDDLTANVLEAENMALSQKNIINSEGAQAGWSLSQTAHMTSGGFYGVKKASRHNLSCIVLAGADGIMERDYEFCSTRHADDMDDPDKIGLQAAQRAAARLGARKPKSCAAPVIYDPRVARSLLGHFAAAISGASIARGSSFLKNEMGQQIFSKDISIIDDPHRPRGLRSQFFDSEGVAGKKRFFVEEGRLTGWMMDWPSARQLGLMSTGHAFSDLGGIPSPAPSNFWIAPSAASPEDLIAEVEHGFYVTELIGAGANAVTGDYSRGAAGFLIKQGKIDHPVNEMTIVGHLKDIFANLSGGNDLIMRYGVDAPTLRAAQMTIAGA